MLASIISSKRRGSEMLAFSNDYYGIILGQHNPSNYFALTIGLSFWERSV